MTAARIIRISGALVEAAPLPAALYEVVRVGDAGLLGEVVRLDGERATVQVYDETTGLRLGEPVAATGAPLQVELGPGLLGSVLDGVGRRLRALTHEHGRALTPGLMVPTLDRGRAFRFEPARAQGDELQPGDVLGTVQESAAVRHLVLVPPGTEGRIAQLSAGELRVGEPVGALTDGTKLWLWHPWPVRRPRPAQERLPLDRPLVTGQRVFDFLFPVAEGGTVAVPGGFGTGKTVIEQSLARYAAADVVVFVGCGERGNEMAEVLEEFPRLVDPRNGRPLMERTVLVVNTSNMPVVAREASVYLGLTLAEFYRDMGLSVAVMVDSLSRWAEALRDVGGRLQEMPGEEGYPTYVGSRLAKLYERAGRVVAHGTPRREGAVTLVCAVSPPGGDFSEPITQASLRVSGGLWALDAGLAHQRQFPAVDWSRSYSQYLEQTSAWLRREAGEDWPRLRARVLEVLQREEELKEIAGLLGADALQAEDRLLLEVAALLRAELLGQSAYDEADAWSPLQKTRALALLALSFLEEGQSTLARGGTLQSMDVFALRRALSEVKSASAEELPRLLRRAAR